MYIPAGALSAAGAINVEAADPPGALPDGLVAASGPYTIQAGSGVGLTGQATLTLYYQSTAPIDVSTAQLYRWSGSQWVALTGNRGPAAVSAALSDFGTYALLAERAFSHYLPAAIK